MRTIRLWLLVGLTLYAIAVLGWVLSRTLPGNPIAPGVVTVSLCFLLLIGVSTAFGVRVVRAVLAREKARPLPPPDGPEADYFD